MELTPFMLAEGPRMGVAHHDCAWLDICRKVIDKLFNDPDTENYFSVLLENFY